MDTVIGNSGVKVLVTMVECKSRYTLIGLAENKKAQAATLRLLEALAGHREKVEPTSFDNGKEFALHELLADLLDAKAYPVHRDHSWEKGLNENTNALIRPTFEHTGNCPQRHLSCDSDCRPRHPSFRPTVRFRC